MLRPLHHLRPHGVQADVTTDPQKIGVPINDDGLEAPLDQMPDLVMAPVVCPRVNAVDVAHEARPVAPVCLHEEVIVIAHQTVGITAGVEALEAVGEDFEQLGPIIVVLKDRLAPITARGQVIQSAGKFETQRASPAGRLSRRRQKTRPDPMRHEGPHEVT